MHVSQMNLDDIKKYWQGCHVKFKETGETIYYITNVDSTYIYAQDSQKEEVLIDLKKGYEIDYVIPKKTTYQFGQQAACLSRLPARMWKKGMNKQNTQFEILGSNGWIQHPYDIGIIEGFVNKPSYYDDTELAVKLLVTDQELLSCAINPRMSLHRKGYIYLDTTMVGRYENLESVDEKKKPRIVCKKIFVPEINKEFPKVQIKGV